MRGATTTTTTATRPAVGCRGKTGRRTATTAAVAKRGKTLGVTSRGFRAMPPTAAAATTYVPPSDGIDVVNVDLGERSYPIYIGTGLLDDGEALRSHVRGSTALVVTNETIAGLGYLDRTVAALEARGNLRVETVVLPDGEEHKNLDVLNQVYTRALETRLDRGTTFVALGGGVIGDMTGYAAASYQRGVKFVQIPTTVMAMVDSSVGGKTGVNHALGKNMIGAFYQPECVLIDIDSLKTLPDREFASGIAEVVKYGLIRDGAFFEWLEANVDKLLARDTAAIAYAVERSCINKAEVVAADEKEGGVRATLNLGHTFGHAIETGLGYGEWLHGEAVSAGMCMAADMSVRLGWIDESLKNRTVALLDKCKTPITVPEKMTVQTFMDLMAVDKKAANGKLRLILLKGPLGECVFTGEFDHEKLKDTLEAYVKN
jgi:3-dehydroquinate synthase